MLRIRLKMKFVFHFKITNSTHFLSGGVLHQRELGSLLLPSEKGDLEPVEPVAALLSTPGRDRHPPLEGPGRLVREVPAAPHGLRLQADHLGFGLAAKDHSKCHLLNREKNEKKELA